MDLFYTTKLQDTQQRMAGYMTLLIFRYMNLSVKAEAAALLPINVFFLGETKNLEEVADVAIPDDYHFAIIPKADNSESLEIIAEGVTMSHPEYKLTVKTTQVQNKDKEYLEYEMPEVDKSRRDFLNEAVKSLHTEAKARIDKVYTEVKASFTDMLSGSPEELDEVNKELNKIYDECTDGITKSKLSKLQEVEDGYQRYLNQHAEEIEKEQPDYDVSKSLKMTD